MLSTSYSCQILIKLEFPQRIFFKKAQISNFIKIHKVVAELFHADGRTDWTNLIGAFRNFVHTVSDLF